MNRAGVLVAALFSIVVPADLGHAQPKPPGVEKLYILDCGEGVAGDISRWSPGINEGKSMDFVDNCYLIKHAQGWFLWDTGIPDAVASMPNGLAPSDPKAVYWRRPKTLAAQLDQIGVTPSDIKAMAVSHTHPDHIGNVEMFPMTMLYVQNAEYEWPGANNTPRFKPEHPVTKLEGDRDVFVAKKPFGFDRSYGVLLDDAVGRLLEIHQHSDFVVRLAGQVDLPNRAGVHAADANFRASIEAHHGGKLGLQPIGGSE